MTIAIGTVGIVRSPDGSRTPGTVVALAPRSFAVDWPHNETGCWFVNDPLLDGTFKLHGMPEDIALRFVVEDAPA